MPPVRGVAGNMAHARCQHHSTYQQDKNVPGDRTRFRTGKHSSSVVCSVFFYLTSLPSLSGEQRKIGLWGICVFVPSRYCQSDRSSQQSFEFLMHVVLCNELYLQMSQWPWMGWRGGPLGIRWLVPKRQVGARVPWDWVKVGESGFVGTPSWYWQRPVASECGNGIIPRLMASEL